MARAVGAHPLGYEAAAPLGDDCGGSPHCVLPAGLASGLTGLVGWHGGPFGAATFDQTMHAVPLSRHSGGGGGRQRDTVEQGAWPSLRSYDGWHLDLFGTSARPPVQAQYLPALGLWVIAAYAWKRADGPWVSWLSQFDAPCELTWHFGEHPPSVLAQVELARGVDLVLGRHAHVGRPPRVADPSWRALADQAIARKAAHPSLSWSAIALSLGIHERTLRDYRRDLRRETETSGVLRLVTAGGA